MNFKIKDWKPTLNHGSIRNGLLLPILIYCLDKKGLPVLGKPRPSQEPERLLENEAYKDIPLVVQAIKDLDD